MESSSGVLFKEFQGRDLTLARRGPSSRLGLVTAPLDFPIGVAMKRLERAEVPNNQRGRGQDKIDSLDVGQLLSWRDAHPS